MEPSNAPALVFKEAKRLMQKLRHVYCCKNLNSFFDQTQVRSKRPLIRLKCARNGLRSALACFSFVRFHARSFSFCPRSLFVRSLSRSLGLVKLILRSLAFRSFVFTLLRFFSLVLRSLVFRRGAHFLREPPLLFCAPILVLLDLHLFVCLFVSSVR